MKGGLNMSYTFICTPQKEWYLKINTIEQLLDYWKNVFNPRLLKAIESMDETREFGKGMYHADAFQSLIGLTSRGENITYQEAYEYITTNHRIGQYQALCDGKTIYINKNFGWNIDKKEVEQFIHKNNLDFPVMKSDKLKIEQFPMGTHYYVFIDGVQLRKDDNLKFNSYQEAYDYAQTYIK